MNVFDYFFEKTFNLEKKFIVGKEEISFRELYERSLALAEKIREEVGEEKSILLLSPNNVFFLLVYLAVLKSGNMVVPIDPMIEEKNFEYIRELSEATLIFVTPWVKKRLNLSGSNVITELTFDTGAGVNSTQPIASDVHFKDSAFQSTINNQQSTASFEAERIAEIIFTSGSTGKPKGVMLTHKNLVANTTSILEYLKLKADDRILVVLPFYYCYGLSLLHTHLRVGGSMVLNNAFIFIGTVINDLKDYGCTGFAGVPSHFQILLRKSDSLRTMKFPNLKYVTQAGGKLAPLFIDEFRKAQPEVDFIVMYGQTEATARLAYLPAKFYEERKGSIGKEIPGVALRVVNEAGEDVRPGATGEVIARGDNVMAGYLKDSESTASALRGSWLYTGDLGTVDEDGFIYLTARSKEIIKVGGKRVSPKEIEEVILSISSVMDCTITTVEDELLGEALKVTVVQNEAKELLTEEMIREHCAKHLALFKIPQVVEIREQLELSPTGKKIKK